MNDLDPKAHVISPEDVRSGVTGQHLRLVLGMGLGLSVVALLSTALLV